MLVKGLSYIDKLPISIDIKGSIINLISKNDKPSAKVGPRVFIAPGFIDHQVNGYIGHSFVDQDLNVQKVQLITKKLRENGVTSYYPTLIQAAENYCYGTLPYLQRLSKILIPVYLYRGFILRARIFHQWMNSMEPI